MHAYAVKTRQSLVRHARRSERRLALGFFQRHNEIIVASPPNGPAHLDQARASCGRVILCEPSYVYVGGCVCACVRRR